MADTRRGVFTLKSGDLILEWPRQVSLAEVEDMQAYLDLTMKMIRRVAERDAAAVPSVSAQETST